MPKGSLAGAQLYNIRMIDLFHWGVCRDDVIVALGENYSFAISEKNFNRP